MLGLSAQLFPSGPTVNLQSALAGNPAKSYLLQCVHHGLKVHAFGQLFLPSATAKKDKWSEDLLLPGSQPPVPTLIFHTGQRDASENLVCLQGAPSIEEGGAT